MTCEHYRKLLTEYATGNLSPEEAREIEHHVESCEVCSAETARLRRIWETLGDMPEEKPGPAVRARFYAMLEDAKAEAAARPRVSTAFERWLVRWWPRRPAFQFAVAVCLLAVGLGIGRQDRGRPAETATAELEMLKTEVAGMQLVMSAALQNQFASVDRIQTIDAISRSGQVSEPVIEALIRTVDADPSVNVRLAAVDALARFLDQRTVVEGMGRTLPNQTSPMVQVSLIDVLAGSEDERSRGVLQDLTENPEIDPGVRRHALARLDEAL